MSERTKQFRVGVVVFATALMTSLLILWNSDFSALPFRSTYQIQMLVDQAPGVAPDTPVRRRGIPIGRVATVEDTDTGAVITMNIDDGKEVKTNEIGRIQSSLIGDAVIEFVADSSPVGATAVPPGTTVQGMYVPNPVDLLASIQGDLRQTIQSLGDAGQEVATLASQLNQVLGENELNRITELVDSTEQAMDEFSAVARNLNDIVGDEEFKQQLKDGFEQLPGVLEDAQSILEALESAVASADQNLKNLQGLTSPLGERGPQIVDSMEGSIRNLENLLAQIGQLSASLNNSEGTFGLLLHDRQLHDQAIKAIAEAQGTIHDVRCLLNDEYYHRRITQILDNVWTITDKLQRDPARVVRGVFDRETPLNVYQR